jgi:hypothetical protein
MPGSRPYAPIGDNDAASFRGEATLGIIEAQIACLHRRRAAASDRDVALDVACQIRDAMAARRALLSVRGRSPETV